jgi:hypothetical protein
MDTLNCATKYPHCVNLIPKWKVFEWNANQRNTDLIAPLIALQIYPDRLPISTNTIQCKSTSSPEMLHKSMQTINNHRKDSIRAILNQSIKMPNRFFLTHLQVKPILDLQHHLIRL